MKFFNFFPNTLTEMKIASLKNSPSNVLFWALLIPNLKLNNIFISENEKFFLKYLIFLSNCVKYFVYIYSFLDDNKPYVKGK